MEKLTEKKLSEMVFQKFRDYYFEACNKRILFYNQIDSGNKEDIAEFACNFLCSLGTFKDKVPKELIIEKFEDFRQAKSLAKEIMRNYL